MRRTTALVFHLSDVKPANQNERRWVRNLLYFVEFFWLLWQFGNVMQRVRWSLQSASHILLVE